MIIPCFQHVFHLFVCVGLLLLASNQQNPPLEVQVCDYHNFLQLSRPYSAIQMKYGNTGLAGRKRYSCLWRCLCPYYIVCICAFPELLSPFQINMASLQCLTKARSPAVESNQLMQAAGGGSGAHSPHPGQLYLCLCPTPQLSFHTRRKCA